MCFISSWLSYAVWYLSLTQFTMFTVQVSWLQKAFFFCITYLNTSTEIQQINNGGKEDSEIDKNKSLKQTVDVDNIAYVSMVILRRFGETLHCVKVMSR